MDDLLFNIPECKSPRLLWMDRYGITLTETDAGDFIASMGSGSRLGYGATDEEALGDVAWQNELPHWNKEAKS